MTTEPKDEPLLVTREHGLRIRSFDEKARTADFVASTDTVDSYGEVVLQNWDLSRFRDNPVILYAHDRWDLPIGKATRCEVVMSGKGIGSPQLECTVEFATAEMNPKADQVWNLVKAGMLRAVSVGFRPRDIRYEKWNGKDVYVLDDNLLLEISVVTIPANPDALAKAKQKAFAAGPTRTIEGVADHLREAWERKAPTTISAPVDAARTEEKDMTVQEMQAALDKAKAELAVANDQLARANEKLDAREKLDEERRIIALKADERALKAEADAKDAAKAAEERVSGLEASNKSLVDTVSKSIEALGGSRKKEDGSDETLVEIALRTAHEMVVREVDALVGEKILPAEKDTFVKLAKADRALFDEMIAQRSELGLLKPVTKGAKLEPSTVSASDNGDDFAKEVEREMAGSSAASARSKQHDDGGDFADAVAAFGGDDF
jgi:HK97 family phage prohead protease